jgi:hypothetical protein
MLHAYLLQLHSLYIQPNHLFLFGVYCLKIALPWKDIIISLINKCSIGLTH